MQMLAAMKRSNKSFNTLWHSIAGIILCFSCSPKENTTDSINDGPSSDQPVQEAISGLASPIRLEPGRNIVYLADYFLHPEAIDSFAAPENIQMQRVGDSLEITAPVAGQEPLQKMKFWVDEERYTIPVFLANKVAHTIRIPSEGHYWEQVQLKGEMNSWNPNATSLTLNDGFWTCELFVEPGNYQYKLVADGEELNDPTNPEEVSNGMGGTNSLLIAQSPYEGTAPKLEVVAANGDRVAIKVTGNARMTAYWQNQEIAFDDHEEAGHMYVLIPESAKNWQRSFVRVYADFEGQLGNDLLIPLEKGKALQSASELDRTDFHQMVLYNAFVDRFYNADSSNDATKSPEEILPPADYHGGDVLGVIAQVHKGYFKELGVNGIWMSPLVKNVDGAYGYWPEPETKFAAYHGYWPTSFTRIDPRLGSSTDLEELVDKAHREDINVFLDFVANHVHEKHPVFQENPDWATNLYLKDGSLNTERWDDHRLTTWFDTFMPSLKLHEPEVHNMLTDSAIWWVKRYDIDGFRHDATKHVPHPFWRALTQKLKQQHPNGSKALYQIGETYGSRGLVGSYVNSGELDAQFDFNVYDDAVAVFAGGEGVERLKAGLEKSLKAYGHHHLMGNISGNQDRSRFISYADGSVSFSEDAKAAGWTRDIQIQDDLAYSKMALLFAYNMSIPGVPVIYYGDEIGMAGGNDPDNRRMMRFENLSEEETALKQTVAALAQFRRDHLAMVYGNTQIHHAENGVFCLSRSYLGETVYLVINNTDAAIALNFLPELASAEAAFGQNNTSLGAYQFELFIQPSI